MASQANQPHPHDDPERTTPMGMVRYGHEFLEAAFVVYERAAQLDSRMVMPPVPALYLLGHGLELTFKAFLLSKGVTLEHLRRKLGHDLEKAFTASKENGLDSLLQSHALDESVLTLLNVMYSTKELEYIVTGAKTIPHYPLLQNFSIKLFDAVAASIGFRDRLARWTLDGAPV
ncbi:MAG: hypothetical protein AAB196_04810 [Pseudomonadota bacterium]|uniref:hypothetical protein n=2 Tax=Comamonadaceae TaxID=80864 RepID=UPI002AD57AE3|nr:hypothetical protein [Delftia tsuruhatensis]WQM81791.1 hypothetical protein RNT40_24245 [Delftia tsuruhatensis]